MRLLGFRFDGAAATDGCLCRDHCLQLKHIHVHVAWTFFSQLFRRMTCFFGADANFDPRPRRSELIGDAPVFREISPFHC
jgi:hypothetical protein